jgi:hypothetical protein
MADDSEIFAASFAQELHAARLRALPNVIGIATGFRQQEGEYRDEIAVQVFVSRKYERSHIPDGALIPRRLEGPNGSDVRTDVIDAGFMQPLVDPTRYRPIKGGSSISAATGTGTLGGWAWDETDNTIVGLTCNHVLTANDQTQLPANDTVIQPGGADGGTTANDTIGAGKRIVPIATASPSTGSIGARAGSVAGAAPVNAVDAAILTVSQRWVDEIVQIGPGIYETGTPTLGDAVQKHGRTTGLTTNGTIISVNASWTLSYPAGSATVGTGPSVFNIQSTDGNRFGDRGDSGSLIFSTTRGVLSTTYPALGIQFAGGGTPFGTIIGASAIGSVFALLNIETLCDGAIEALLAAIGGSGTTATTSAKMLQLRRLRDEHLAQTSAGAAFLNIVTMHTPALASSVLTDDETFGLVVKALAPLLSQPTNIHILDTTIDAEMLVSFQRVARRMRDVVPEAGSTIEQLVEAAAKAEGQQVREALTMLDHS